MTLASHKPPTMSPANTYRPVCWASSLSPCSHPLCQWWWWQHGCVPMSPVYCVRLPSAGLGVHSVQPSPCSGPQWGVRQLGRCPVARAVPQPVPGRCTLQILSLAGPPPLCSRASCDPSQEFSRNQRSAFPTAEAPSGPQWPPAARGSADLGPGEGGLPRRLPGLVCWGRSLARRPALQ